MTDTTTRNLAHEVAEALVSIGKLKYLLPHADYPNDLNACARDLTREGYQVGLMESADQWLAFYLISSINMDKYATHILETQSLASTPAIAWCESFLALCKHVDGKAGEGRSG